MTLKSICKRGIAAVLSAAILFFTMYGGYSRSEVFAASTTEMYFTWALETILERSLAAKGYSYSTKEDLDISVQGLKNLIESYKDVESFSDAVHLTFLYNAIIGKKIGDKIDLGEHFAPIMAIIDAYLTAQLAGTASYDAVFDVSMSNVKTEPGIEKVKTGSLTTDFLEGLLPAPVKMNGSEVYFNENVKGMRGALSYNRVEEGVNISYLAYFPSVTTALVKQDGYYVPAYYSRAANGTLSFYCGNTYPAKYVGVSYLTPDWCPGPSADGKYYHSLGTAYSLYKDDDVAARISVPGYRYDVAACNPEKFKIYVDSSLPVFSSFNAYQTYIAQGIGVHLKQKVVGSTAVSKPVPKTVTVTDESVASQVEAAVNDASKDGAALTDEEIDAIAQKIIDKVITDTDADDKPGAVIVPGDVADVPDYSGAITDIFSSLEALRLLIKSFAEQWTDGSSALQRDISNIRENFEVVQGGGNSDNDEDPKVWLPVGGVAVVKFLKPLLDYFGNPLSEITKFLNKIMGLMDPLSLLPQLFDKSGELYLGNIFSSLSSIVSYAGQVSRTLGNLPAAIAEVIEIPQINPDEIVEAFNKEFAFPDLKVEIPAIEIPEIKIPEIEVPAVELPDIKVNFPFIPDYMDILGQILSAVQNLFVIDTAAVSAACEGFGDVWDNHFPFIAKVKGIFGDLSLRDDGSYPVIQVETFKILKPYYKQDYIVILDFADYAVYLQWARRLVRAVLWVAFGYSLLRRVRVRFHIS